MLLCGGAPGRLLAWAGLSPAEHESLPRACMHGLPAELSWSTDKSAALASGGFVLRCGPRVVLLAFDRALTALDC